MKRTLTLFLATLLATGCLEREETIRVSPEGALAIEHQLRGDRGERGGETESSDMVDLAREPRLGGPGRLFRGAARWGARAAPSCWERGS